MCVRYVRQNTHHDASNLSQFTPNHPDSILLPVKKISSPLPPCITTTASTPTLPPVHTHAPTRTCTHHLWSRCTCTMTMRESSRLHMPWSRYQMRGQKRRDRGWNVVPHLRRGFTCASGSRTTFFQKIIIIGEWTKGAKNSTLTFLAVDSLLKRDPDAQNY